MVFEPEVYQLLLSDFLQSHPRAGAFVGVGMGKTATVLHAFQALRADGVANSMLVVAPLRVASMTWPNEIEKWDQFRELKVEHLRRTGDRPSGRAHIYLTNYERLNNIRDLSAIDVVTFDELTKAKNPASSRIKAFRPLLKKRHWRWGLTGTPRPNSLLELFAQIRLLDDGQRLGPSFSAFRQRYFESDYMGYTWTPRAGSEQVVYEKIRDLTITMRSSDYLDVPDTIVEDIEVTLPDNARRSYKEVEKELLAVIEGHEIIAVNAAVLVGKLLQICTGACYDLDRKTVKIHDAKIEALQMLVTKLYNQGENVLIACNHIHERKRVCEALGTVDAHTYEGNLENDWNAGKIRALVADPRGLGHGLNLQGGGRTVIWFSPTYSRELFDQFNGRVARKGQQEQPQVFRLVCRDTIEEAVLETLRVRGDEQKEMLALLSNFKRAHL